MTSVLRSAEASDLESILHVHQKAFGTPQEAKVVQLLHERNKHVVSLIAVDEGGTVIGSIVYSQVDLDPPNPKFHALGLAPIAVLPEFQQKGIGSQLIQQSIQICKEKDYNALVVLGNPKYYSRFGFLKASDFGLGNEYKADDAFMVMELEKDILQNVEGVVKFAPEFKESDC